MHIQNVSDQDYLQILKIACVLLNLRLTKKWFLVVWRYLCCCSPKRPT